MTNNVRIQVKRDSAANWTSNNPILAAGELGFETDTGKLKVGDGSTVWNSLQYFLLNIVEDITPQLGGNLDCSTNSITEVDEISGETTTRNGVRIGNNIWLNEGCTLTEIQAAMDELSETNTRGGTVYLPAGEWTINSAGTVLTIPLYVNLIGPSKNHNGAEMAQFNCSYGTNWAITAGGYNLIQNINFDLDDYGLLAQADFVTVRDCRFDGGNKNERGIATGGGTNYRFLRVDGCSFNQCQFGVLFYDAYNFITNNWFWDNAYGVYAGGEYSQIIGNTFYGSDSAAIRLSSAGNYCAVIGNPINGNAISNSGTGNQIGYNP